MADEIAAPDELVDSGQVAPEAPVTEEPQAFHRYTHDDGTEHVFKDTDELNKYLREGTLRHADYTKKTQTAAAERRRMEQQAQSILQRQNDVGSREGKLKEYDEWLSPERIRVIEAMMNAPQAGQPDRESMRRVVDQARSEDKDKLDRFDKFMTDYNQEQEKAAAFESLKKAYPELDTEVVNQNIKELSKAPPGDELRSLMELIWLANVGKQSPVAIEQKVVEAQEHKRQLNTPMPKGTTVAKKGSPDEMTLDEAVIAARAEYD